MSIALIVAISLGLVPAGFMLVAGFIALGLRIAIPWWFGGHPINPEELGETLDGYASWWVRKGTWIGVFWLILLLGVLASGI